jgi:hypothetical protein
MIPIPIPSMHSKVEFTPGEMEETSGWDGS